MTCEQGVTLWPRVLAFWCHVHKAPMAFHSYQPGLGCPQNCPLLPGESLFMAVEQRRPKVCRELPLPLSVPAFTESSQPSPASFLPLMAGRCLWPPELLLRDQNSGKKDNMLIVTLIPFNLFSELPTPWIRTGRDPL